MARITEPSSPSGAPASGPSRRAVLGGALGAAALTAAQWTPAFRVLAGSAQAATPAPPTLPDGLTPYQQAWSNWSGEVSVDPVWIVAPNTPADVVALANWAHAAGWRLRPLGAAYTWSPLVLPTGVAEPTTLLVDASQHLTAVTVNGGSPASVTAQAGATMDSLLETAGAAGYGFQGFPVIGACTIGGVLATGGRGTGVPAVGETGIPGQTYGSVGNTVVSLTAVVWDAPSGQYVLRTFQRTDPEIQALLPGLGRVFVTEVTLRVGAEQRIRAQSWYNVSADTLFAAPASAGSNSLSAYVDRTGHVVCIWFPYTSDPWLRIFWRTPTKPWNSREISAPYQYSFNDIVPKNVSDLLSQIEAGAPTLTPTMTQTQMSAIEAGIVATGTWDMWGWTRDQMRYVRPTTLRITSTCYGVTTARSNIQRAVSEWYAQYRATLATYNAQGVYPMNGPIEIRVTGLDDPADVEVPGALGGRLSSMRPRPDHPEWDVIVWFDMTTVPVTPGCRAFYRDMEQWFLTNYSSYGAVRPEWSKGMANTATATWADPTMLTQTVPGLFSAGFAADDGFSAAVAQLDALDPNRVFSSPVLDALLP